MAGTGKGQTRPLWDERNVDEVDFIVVGAGSSGCVLAARLSEDTASTVALIEAGGHHDHTIIDMPLAWMTASMMPRFGWEYMTEPEPFLENRPLPFPRGKLLGGCSSVNGTMYIRGAAADYDGWRDAGLGGWGYADVLPYFKRAETNWRGEGPEHGGSGPLAVSPLTSDPLLTPTFRRAAGQLGYPESEDFNIARPEGFGLPDVSVNKGRRHSTARAYLDPAKSRSNLRVETDALVTRVLIRDGRAYGIEVRRGDAVHVIHARREVILCGGAFNSPHLLMLSGVGPAAQLREQGIDVLVDLPGVGSNLQDHAMALSMYAASGPITFDSQLRLDRLARSVVEWQLFGTGNCNYSPLSIQGFLRSSPEEPRPDLQMQVSHTSFLARPWFPGWREGAGHQFTAGALLLSPKSTGKVSLRSPDPTDKPAVLTNFLQEQSDRIRLREAIRIIRRFFATPAASALVQAELGPSPDMQDDDAIDAWNRATVMSGGHPTSTCAMGTGPAAVVDAELRVRGIAGLRVVDASVMPDVIRGNTNAPCVMIAEKASDMIRKLPPLPAEPAM